MDSKGGGPGANHDKQIWLLGNSHPAADRSIGWHDRIPNLGDADILIIDMTTLTEDSTYQIGRRELGHIQKSIRDRLLGGGGGGTIVVIMGAMFWAPPPDAATRGPIVSFDGSLDPYAYSNYHVLPTVPEITQVAKGHKILPDASHDFKLYLDAVRHFGFYIEGHDRTISLGFRGPRFYLEKVDGQSVMDNSGHYLGFTLVMTEEEDDMRTRRVEKTGKLVFLPPYTDPAPDAIGKTLFACRNLPPDALPAPGRVEGPALAPGDQAAPRERVAGPPGGAGTTGPAPGGAGGPAAAAATAGGGTDAFLSYHHEVKDSVARPLVKGLKKRGVTVWWDYEAIGISDTVSQKIKEGLDGARCGVAIVSRGYMDSAWGKTELGAMFGKGMQIFPVLFGVEPEEAQKLPPISGTNMRAWDDAPESVMDEIANAIKGDSGQKDHNNPCPPISPGPPPMPPFSAPHSQKIAHENRMNSPRTKVFISHAFGGDDEELASTLKKELGAAGLDGHLAEESQRYDLLIGDKIRQEIDESDWLVAIITERGQASASVHEEIAYALKGGALVALMIEEGVEKRGVLVHAKEYETFGAPNFAEHSRKVARSIADSPRLPTRRHPLGEDARAFLEGRKILSADSADFAQNAHFPSLYSGPLGDDEKPAVIFTACPHGLGDRCDVTTSKFIEWAKSTRYVGVDGRQIRVPGTEQSVDINTLRITEKRFGTARKNVVLYREYLSTGFLEWGTSYMFFNRNKKGKIEVHLCYMIGSFWAFLASARRFYEEIGLDAPFSVILSIRKSSTLGLRNAGDYVYDDPPNPFSSPPPAQPDPATDRPHIRIEFHFDTVRDMTDERIAAVAKKAARDVCNAYGQAVPMCYGADGSFSWRLWDEIHSKAAGGGRL